MQRGINGLPEDASKRTSPVLASPSMLSRILYSSVDSGPSVNYVSLGIG